MDDVPACLRIGYQDIKILCERSSLSEMHGEYNTVTSIIKINIDNSPVEVVNTLLHESLHAIWHNQGLIAAFPDNFKHEHIVTAIANGLTQVFRDNVGFLEWIDRNLKRDANDGA